MTEIDNKSDASGAPAVSVRRRMSVLPDGRRVHYQVSGNGPALLLLHASPVSSQAFVEGHLPLFSTRFTCIAPDTPGNGYSDPLPNAASASIEDYADGLASFLDSIGIEQCVLYGRHTGALIATVFAQRFPARARFVYCDGYSKFAEADLGNYLGEYLAPFEADWAGAFLSWLWFRYRDQHVFWPWHLQDNSHRSNADVPSLPFIQKGVLDFLLSGNDYIGPYSAAIRGSVTVEPMQTPVPICFACRENDSLLSVQARLVDLPSNAWKEKLPADTAAAVTEELGILQEYADGPTASLIDTLERGRRKSATPYFVDLPKGQLFARLCRSQDPKHRPIVMLPRFPGGGDYLESLQIVLSETRDVWLFDVPGHADSAVSVEHEISAYAESIRNGLDKLGIDEFDLYGHRGGALIASELAKSLLAGVRVIHDEPILLSTERRQSLMPCYEFDLAPTWNGAHLSLLWHHLRDQELWFPWNDRTTANSLQHPWGDDIEAHRRHFVNCMKRPESYSSGWQAILRHNWAEERGDVSARLTLTSVGDPFFESHVAGVEETERPNSDAKLAALIVAAL